MHPQSNLNLPFQSMTPLASPVTWIHWPFSEYILSSCFWTLLVAFSPPRVPLPTLHIKSNLFSRPNSTAFFLLEVFYCHNQKYTFCWILKGFNDVTPIACCLELELLVCKLGLCNGDSIGICLQTPLMAECALLEPKSHFLNQSFL